jgi:hypothetical protein
MPVASILGSETMKPDVMLWLSDERGVYIPRDFATSFADRDKNVSGVSKEDWTCLEAGPNPENEWYWDAWNNVCDNAKVTDENGAVYTVYQDGYCWLIPIGMEWSEENEFFAWPNEEEETEQ